MSNTEYTNVNTGRYLTIDVGLLYATTSFGKALCYKLTTRLRTNRWVKWFSIKQKCEHCAFARITNFDDNAEYIRFNTLILEWCKSMPMFYLSLIYKNSHRMRKINYKLLASNLQTDDKKELLIKQNNVDDNNEMKWK